MKAIRTPIMAIIAAAILVIPLGISAFQQLVFAEVDGRDFLAWRKQTHEFEKAVIDAAVGNPDEGPEPHLIPGLLQSYSDSVMRILLGGPDTIPGLLEQYQQAVLRVFGQPPPEGDKRAQHDQIKEFRLVTHAFEKAVISAISDPED